MGSGASKSTEKEERSVSRDSVSGGNSAGTSQHQSDGTDHDSTLSDDMNEDESSNVVDPVTTAFSVVSKQADMNNVRLLQKQYSQQDMIQTPPPRDPKISNVRMLEIGIALRENQTITSIDLRHQEIDKYGLLWLLQELYDNSALTSLDLSYNFMGSKNEDQLEDSIACIALAKVLSSDNSAIEALNVEVNNLAPFEGVILGDSLARNSSLKVLRLNDNFISNPGALAIGTALQTNMTLQFLELNNNCIDAEGLRHLTSALCSSTALKYLHLEKNDLNSEGCKVLSHGIASNSSLEILSLWGNNIGNDGAKYLANSLVRNTSLSDLNVGDNNMDGHGIKSLFNSLQENKSLNSLQLWYNRIDEEGMMCISAALKRNIHLRSLNLHAMYGLTGSMALVLAAALRHNSNLQSLDIGGNENFSIDAKSLFLPFLRDSKVSELRSLHGIVLTDFLELLQIEYSPELTNSSILTILRKRRKAQPLKPKRKKKPNYVTRAQSYDLEAVVQGLQSDNESVSLSLEPTISE